MIIRKLTRVPDAAAYRHRVKRCERTVADDLGRLIPSVVFGLRTD